MKLQEAASPAAAAAAAEGSRCCCCLAEAVWYRLLGTRAAPPQLPRSTNSPLAHVNLSLLAGEVGEAATNTADGGQGVHDLLLAIHVGVQHTQNVLKVVAGDEGLQQSSVSEHRMHT